jgi:hypothetical protein
VRHEGEAAPDQTSQPRVVAGRPVDDEGVHVPTPDEGLPNLDVVPAGRHGGEEEVAAAAREPGREGR